MNVEKYDLTYLSFGAGVQSTALLVCSNLGLHGVPRADVAIFADTGFEPAYVYAQVERMKAWSGIPVVIVKPSESTRKSRHVAIPAFTQGADGSTGISQRQCTQEWKVRPIEREVRVLLGYRPKQRVKKTALCMVGISMDEAHRMKPSWVPWITKSHPLVDARLRRSDCLRITVEAGLPKPERSACYFCPFHSTHEWKFLRDKHPGDMAKAEAYDASLRDGTSPLRNAAFVHRSLVPLSEVVFDRPEKSMFPEVDAFGNECEGMCGV